MFVRSTAVLALLSVAAQVAVAAQPPACVIAAVNTESDPSDFKTICSSDKALQYMTDNCGNNLKAAQDYFADVCKTNGQQVTFPTQDDKNSTSTESSSPSATKSGSGGGSASQTGGGGSGSGSGSGGGSGTYGSNANSPTPSSSSSTSGSTGAASSIRLASDALGMGALFAFGAMLAI
ncbi:hypothetical protein BST61_g4018 [Cercospora zeina]